MYLSAKIEVGICVFLYDMANFKFRAACLLKASGATNETIQEMKMRCRSVLVRNVEYCVRDSFYKVLGFNICSWLGIARSLKYNI